MSDRLDLLHKISIFLLSGFIGCSKLRMQLTLIYIQKQFYFYSPNISPLQFFK